MLRVANGCDIVSLERFAVSLDRGGDRLLAKLFTPAELELGLARRSDPAYWAVRFAAKEALAKALGVGIWQDGTSWQQIEVVKGESGQPGLSLSGRCLEIYQDQAWQAMSLSLSHDCCALATVVLVSGIKL